MPVPFRLYLITGASLGTCLGMSPTTKLELALRSGVKAVQLREKNLPDRRLWQYALALRKLTRQFGAQLFVNDRLDISLLAEADGIHLPEEGLSCSLSRKYLSKKLLGKSVHSLEKAKESERDGADFLLFGPVFPTQSKQGILEPRGLKFLDHVASAVKIPVFAVGGIKPDKAKSCLNSGAAGVAVISAIWDAENIPSAVASFQKELGGL